MARRLQIKSTDIIEAAKNLRAQTGTLGPILGFTLKEDGAPFSVTYDFVEADSREQKVVDLCIAEFAKCLNAVLGLGGEA